MRYILLALLIGFLAPGYVFASPVTGAPSSFSAAQTLVVASSSPGNSYFAGASVVLTAPVKGDLLACGGSLVLAAPVEGDDLLFAGSISSRASVAGDLRAIGGSIDVKESVRGDLFAAGFSVNDTGFVGGNTFIIGANTTMSGGASGPVTIYGNNVLLAGDFLGDVHIFATGHVTLAPQTHIHGRLSYEAPETIVVPATVTIDGGMIYSSISYLPDAGTSRMLAFLSIGLFLIARIIGALLLAGLLAGLFPKFAQKMVARMFRGQVRELLLTLLLGFAVMVATPAVVALLLITFVGGGLALLIGMLYVLALLLSLIYAGILIGGILARRFRGREVVMWHDGVIGMILLSLAALVPIVGPPLALFCVLYTLGALLQTSFHFAFPREGSH
jgi:hypothetical protein